MSRLTTSVTSAVMEGAVASENYTYVAGMGYLNDQNMYVNKLFHLGEDGVMEDTTVATDNVNKPDHYNTGAVECIDYLRDNMPRDAFEGYLEGCAKKYMHRWRYKGVPLQDLKKAKWYLEYLISEVGLWEEDGD